MKKQKKPFITRIRMFMAAGSFVGLVGGWALLAQTDAPTSVANSTTAIVETASTQPADFVTIAPAATLAASDTAAATTAAAKAASTPTSTATATKVTTTTTLPVLRTRSS